MLHGPGWRLVAAALILSASPALAGVVDYEIEVGLDPASHRLSGVENIRWTNPTDTPTAEIYLHLYLNAFASSQTTFMREVGGRSLERPCRWFG